MGILAELPIGARYGKLVIVKELPHGHHLNGKMKRIVELLCDCGNIKSACITDVKAYKDTASCGKCYTPKPIEDLTGTVSGKLTVVGVSGLPKIQSSGKKALQWRCTCECGRGILLRYHQIKNQTVLNCGICSSPKNKASIGDIKINKDGFRAKLIEIIAYNQYLIIIEGCSNNTIVNYTTFMHATFVSPYKVTVGGVGYYGEGDFISKVNGKHTPEYRDWGCMMKRCYTQQEGRNSAYKDVFVDSDWHNFQNFAKWCTSQPNFNKDGWRLDKDLLSLKSGHVMYSKDTCTYLPVEINGFIKTKRMNDLPIGVDRCSLVDGITRYRAQARFEGKNIGLGSYKTCDEASLVYKNHKEMLAKILADKYKDELTERAYNAIYNYEVLESY